MRVKQTARKSTASQQTPAQSQDRPAGSQNRNVSAGLATISSTPRTEPRPSRTKVLNDPLGARLHNLLQTKRKSATPSQRSFNTSQAGTTSGTLGSSTKRIYADQVKTKPRSKPGEMALREIRKLQKSHQLLIPRAAFHRIVREITQDVMADHRGSDGDNSIRYQTAALEALQEATESYLVQMFEDSYLCCLHAKRVTLFIQDVQLCRRLQQGRPLL